MGINYYFFSTNKELIQESFAINENWGISGEEYRIVDEPYLGYKIHLNKLSCGWRPLFQSHKIFKTFKELEKFYQEHKSDLEIYDDYGDKYSWEKYFINMYNHSLREKKPLKWVYESDDFFRDRGAILHTVQCSEEEAELYQPYDHVIYTKTEQEARNRLNVHERSPYIKEKFWNDPDYLFDWTEGEFS